jgi:hypothetical protein
VEGAACQSTVAPSEKLDQPGTCRKGDDFGRNQRKPTEDEQGDAHDYGYVVDLWRKGFLQHEFDRHGLKGHDVFQQLRGYGS